MKVLRPKVKNKENIMHDDPVIASRSFTNNEKEQFNLFIEDKEPGLTMMIEHINANGELVLNLKISKEVLEGLKIMCEAALEQIKDTEKDEEAFKNWR
jgi:hypothetical protein